MYPPRKFVTAAATACLLIAYACYPSAADAQTNGPSGDCGDAADLAVLTSPITPWKRAPLRVVFASEKPIEGELSLITPNGKVAAKSDKRGGGPPYFWFAEVKSPTAGKWQAKLTRNGATADCPALAREITVRKSRPAQPGASRNSVWPVRDSWNRNTENLYSAWIEKLFDAPLEETLSWKALHEVLRDRDRNFLHDHLGLREDQQGLVVRPDCADLPYFLRAYFAFKMGLPFGYSKCSRGGGGKAPRCYQWWNIQKEEPPPAPPRQQTASNDPFSFFAQPPPKKVTRQSQRPSGLVPGFGYYLRTTVANGVHSGAGRTAGDDSKTDLYPVPLTREALRPGTVYADPYGHLLLISKRLPQPEGGAGLILAVNAQPDGTVSRKRFWRGNFLFSQDPALGGPGFKNFRPIVKTKNGSLRRLTNEEIAEHPDYGNFSLEQSKLSIEAFYDRMDDVMSPAPLDPVRAIKEAVAALEEQVNARVTSVENGREFQIKGGSTVSMPAGPSIFETTGAWEDFATPARDLRLLIAIDVVRHFPDRVARRPERYAMPQDKSAADVKAELESVLVEELSARKFSYKRTDGSEWTLTIKDVVDRVDDLEMAYNINDCVEHRWGAPDGSKEASTCKRRAPGSQRAKMTEYREWFQERRRPPRG